MEVLSEIRLRLRSQLHDSELKIETWFNELQRIDPGCSTGLIIRMMIVASVDPRRSFWETFKTVERSVRGRIQLPDLEDFVRRNL